MYDRILFLQNNICHYSAEYSAETISAKSGSFCLSAETRLFCRNYYFLQKELISVTEQGHVRLIHPFKEVYYGKKCNCSLQNQDYSADNLYFSVVHCLPDIAGPVPDGINGGIRSVTVGAHLASRSARYSISCLSSSLMFSESSGIYLSFLMAFIFLICESAIVFFSTSAVNIYAKLTL